MTTKTVSKEQEEEFRARLTKGNTISLSDFERFWQSKPRFNPGEYEAFLNATDEKCE
jgi:hypothetical protein